MRIVTSFAVGVIALMAAACGGGSPETFTRSDVLQILDAAPTMPAGASWTKRDGIDERSPEDVRLDVVRTQGGFADAIDALMEAGFQRGFMQGWRSGRTEAAAEASLFPDAAAAQKGFAANQRLVPSWFLPIPVEGFGDEAVSSKSDLGAIYMWRRGNLVLSASILRGGGRLFDFDGAARAYAEGIDELAQTR